MALDALVTNPGRLRILTSLAAEPSQEFVQLRQRTRLTDGNLSTHAKRLHNAGLLAIEKTFREGKPVTTITLTPQGRSALERHVRGLMQALNLAPSQAAQTTQTTTISFAPASETHVVEEEWVD